MSDAMKIAAVQMRGGEKKTLTLDWPSHRMWGSSLQGAVLLELRRTKDSPQLYGRKQISTKYTNPNK